MDTEATTIDLHEALPAVIPPGTRVTTWTARLLAADLRRLCDELEPLNVAAFAPVCTGIGTTLEELAERAGVDLATATRADARCLSAAAGRMLADQIGIDGVTQVRVVPAHA